MEGMLEMIDTRELRIKSAWSLAQSYRGTGLKFHKVGTDREMGGRETKETGGCPRLSLA